MTKADSNRREKIRLKMCEHQSEASKYRSQLDSIDKKDEQESRDKIFGKCFALRCEEEKEICGYARVESFAEHDFKPVGTKLYFYGKGKNKILQVEFNSHIFEEYITNGTQISHARFNAYLKEVKSMIKLKK